MAQLPDVQHHLADLMSGMAIRYPMPGTETHPLVGRPAPDLDLGPARVHELLRSGHGILLDPADTFARVAGPGRTGWTGWARAPTPSRCSSGRTATCAGGADDLEPALDRWFGEPS